MRLPLLAASLALIPACTLSAPSAQNGEGGGDPSGVASAGVSGGGAGGGPSGAGGGPSGAGGGPSGVGGGPSGAGGGAPEPQGPVRYPAGRRHAPLAKSVIERLASVLAGSAGRPSVFAKIGDSNTVNNGFLRCFSGVDVKLGAHGALEPTRAFYAQTLADGAHTSFDRTTLAAKVGWTSGAVLTGDPSPLAQEIAAIAPAFAVVLLGTNDTTPQGVDPFAQNLLRIVDEALAAGVVPWLTTLPQRADTAEATALVPEMNAIVRAVAQARQVPLMDLFGALEGLPSYGLIADGVHLDSYASGGAHACWFDGAALDKGMNQRNLLTLEALDRARRFLLDGDAPEPRPAELAGEGSWQSPFAIDALPFVDNRDTAESETSSASAYACAPADEGGPEVVYRLTLAEKADLRLRVLDGAGVDVDVHFMADPGGPDQCLGRADKVLDVTAGPGTYWIAVDTYVAASGPQPGPYLLTVLRR